MQGSTFRVKRLGFRRRDSPSFLACECLGSQPAELSFRAWADSLAETKSPAAKGHMLA